MTVTIRYVFSEINFIHKYFRWSFAQLIKMLKYDRIDISEGIKADKQMNQENLSFAIIGIS